MHPELFNLPGGFGIKTYGFCLMVGFLSAVWLAMKRAGRVKADPEIILNLSFLSLIFGVGGARAFFVVHYWKDQFADQPNKLLAIINVREGGLEFLGGFLGAVAAVFVYARVKKISSRLYLDILAPSLMWGLAFGRIGCFFNGCCFGAPCILPETEDQPRYVWAVRFPYGSPAYHMQWRNRQVTTPAELITTGKQAMYGAPIRDAALSMPVEKRYKPVRKAEQLAKRYEKAKRSDPDSTDTSELKADLADARESLKSHIRKNHLEQLFHARHYPSRQVPTRQISDSELEELADSCRTLPVHPTQLYSSASAFLLSGLLSALFYIRKRHGLVFCATFLLYPISRFILELIRVDNPHDAAGLTVSQFVSISMFVAGVILTIALYRFLPERSPRAVAYVPPESADED